MQKRLHRSRKYRIFGGVAGGFSEYFNVDPIFIRIIFVLFTIYNGIGLLIYIVLWIVLEQEPLEYTYQFKPEEEQYNMDSTSKFANPQSIKKSSPGRFVIGITLTAIGVLFFLDRFIPSFCSEDIIPIALIAIGSALIWNSFKK